MIFTICILTIRWLSVKNYIRIQKAAYSCELLFVYSILKPALFGEVKQTQPALLAVFWSHIFNDMRPELQFAARLTGGKMWYWRCDVVYADSLTLLKVACWGLGNFEDKKMYWLRWDVKKPSKNMPNIKLKRVLNSEDSMKTGHFPGFWEGEHRPTVQQGVWGNPSQNGNVNRCIVSHQLHATIHLAYGRCPWEVAFFPPTSQDFARPKAGGAEPVAGKKKPWPSRHGWQASYYKLASHKGDQGAWNPTTCEWLYRFWDCKRTGWSFTWLESQYDNESYGIWCMNQESPWKRVNHCPKGVS